MKKVLLLLSALISTTALSAEVPHTFTDGEPAYANEINDNFESLSTGINTNDVRIANIENPTPVKIKQMFCFVKANQEGGAEGYMFFENFTQARCNVPEDNLYKIDMTIDEIVNDGWRLVSAIGGGQYYLFHK